MTPEAAPASWLSPRPPTDAPGGSSSFTIQSSAASDGKVFNSTPLQLRVSCSLFRDGGTPLGTCARQNGFGSLAKARPPL